MSVSLTSPVIMITPISVSSCASVSARLISKTVRGRNALWISGRLMVIFAMPSAAVWYVTSTSGGSSFTSAHWGTEEEMSSKPSERTHGALLFPVRPCLLPLILMPRR